MKKARRTLKRFGIDVKRLSRGIVKFGALMAAAITAGTTVLIRRSFLAIDALAKTSDKLGITTEALAGFQFVARKAGVEVRTFNMGLQRLVRRVSEAAIGTGEAQGAIKELGLDAAKLGKLSPDDVMRRLVKAFGNVKNQADRVRLAFKLFDSEGVALVNIVGMSAEALDKMLTKAKALGLTVSRDLAARIEQANNSLVDLSGLFQGIGNRISSQFAPKLTFLIDQLVAFEIETRQVSRVFVSAFTFMVDTVTILGKALIGLVQLMLEVRKAFGTAMASAINGIADGLIKVASISKEVFTFLPQSFKTTVLGIKQLVREGLTPLRLIADTFTDMAENAETTIGTLGRLKKLLDFGVAPAPDFAPSRGGGAGRAAAAISSALGGGTAGARQISSLRDVIPGGGAAKKQNVFDAEAKRQRDEQLRYLRDMARAIAGGTPPLLVPLGP